MTSTINWSESLRFSQRKAYQIRLPIPDDRNIHLQSIRVQEANLEKYGLVTLSITKATAEILKITLGATMANYDLPITALLLSGETILFALIDVPYLMPIDEEITIHFYGVQEIRS